MYHLNKRMMSSKALLVIKELDVLYGGGASP